MATQPRYITLPHETSAWTDIVRVLSAPIDGHAALASAMSEMQGRSVFQNTAISNRSDGSIVSLFWSEALPFMQQIALRMPQLFAGADAHLPILYRGMNAQVTLSQEQVACLLAHGFFGTVHAPAGDFPHFYIGGLLEQRGLSPVLVCIFHYFVAVSRAMPAGRVSFERKGCTEGIASAGSPLAAEPLCAVAADGTGTIEGSSALLHADFANKYIGGGVLNGGLVQEEILFSIKPECLVSMLFCEVMGPCESIAITGAQRFSNYSGYNRSFRCSGFHDDTSERDEHGRIRCSIVALDAVVAHYVDQWATAAIERDVTKAFAAFMKSAPPTDQSGLPASQYYTAYAQDNGPVATGNWGCGAFGGDKSLKFMQQWAAASMAGRSALQYFSFGESYRDVDLVTSITQCHEIAQQRRLTVANLNELMYNHRDENLFEVFVRTFGSQ